MTKCQRKNVGMEFVNIRAEEIQPNLINKEIKRIKTNKGDQ